MDSSQELKKEGAVNLFISYSHEDESYRKKLEKHLARLEDRGVINIWSDRKITAGTEWEKDIERNIESAHVIILLISSEFLASGYCSGVEMARAFEKHEAGEVRVIPVILRPVDWSDERFAKLQVLPKNGKPVSDWHPQDKAWVQVVKQIKSVRKEILRSRGSAFISSKNSGGGFKGVHQLIPTPVLHPVGRRNEIKRVVQTLQSYTSVAITGIAGVGKTTPYGKYPIRKIPNTVISAFTG